MRTMLACGTILACLMVAVSGYGQDAVTKVELREPVVMDLPKIRVSPPLAWEPLTEHNAVLAYQGETVAGIATLFEVFVEVRVPKPEVADIAAMVDGIVENAGADLKLNVKRRGEITVAGLSGYEFDYEFIGDVQDVPQRVREISLIAKNASITVSLSCAANAFEAQNTIFNEVLKTLAVE